MSLDQITRLLIEAEKKTSFSKGLLVGIMIGVSLSLILCLIIFLIL